MGELEHYFVGLIVALGIMEMLGRMQCVEEITIGVDGKRMLGTSYAHVVLAQFLIGRMLGMGDEHQDMVKLMAFGLVDGADHDV